MRSAAVGFQCVECVKQGAATIRKPKAAYGGRARVNPEVTYALIGLNVLMFVLTQGFRLGPFGGGAPSELFEKLADTPCQAVFLNGQCFAGDGVAGGAYYRLLSSMFLHFGLVHLFLNMYCLYLVGPHLERALGRLRFAALYLLGGLSGSALSYALGQKSQLAAGASGAVFGLFAAFYVLERKRGYDVSQITATIALNLVFSFSVRGIDWHAHVGGLIGGALVTAALVYAPEGRQRWVVQVIGCVCVAVVVVAVVVARTAQLTG
jgi:membrane associated rhomboid family serine protease